MNITIFNISKNFKCFFNIAWRMLICFNYVICIVSNIDTNLRFQIAFEIPYFGKLSQPKSGNTFIYMLLTNVIFLLFFFLCVHRE